jgi:hypothetical protein
MKINQTCLERELESLSLLAKKKSLKIAAIDH